MPTENQDESDESTCKYIPDKSREEEIIEMIQRAAAEMGEPLTMNKYAEWRDNTNLNSDTHIVSKTTIKKRFGGWEKACQMANVESNVSVQAYTLDDVVSAIQQAAVEMGEPLTMNKYVQWRSSVDEPVPHPITIIQGNQHFNSWTDACESVGVTAGVRKRYDNDDIISAILQAADEMGEPLRIEDYQEWRESTDERKPGEKTVYTKFDSWFQACEEAGVGTTRKTNYNTDDIISSIQRAAAEMGEPLTLAAYSSWRKSANEHIPSEKVIYKGKFGSWPAVCEAAGVSPATKSHYNTDEMIEAIQLAAAEMGEPLSQSKYNQWHGEAGGTPCVSTITNSELGLWSEACEAAGVKHAGSQIDN